MTTEQATGVLQKAAPSARADVWLAPELQMRPLAARRCVVRNPSNGVTLELSAGEHAVLSACEEVGTLDEHTARAVRRLGAPPEHQGAIREFIERCARRGLLLSLPDLVARFGHAAGEPLAPFAGIVLRTADRPQEVRRLFAEALALQERTGNAYHWHVVDDSRHAESRRANREAMVAHPAVASTHHDLSTEASLEADLCTQLPDLVEEIHWLLGPARGDELTYGRVEDYLLLRFAGRRILMIEDDVGLGARQPPVWKAGVEITLQPEAAFRYEKLEDAWQACPPLDLDPFAAHLRWLGLPMAEAWTQAQREEGGLRVLDLPTDSVPCFAADACVLFTRSQLIGDPGWDALTTQQLVPDEETRRWLATHPDAARYAFESQIYWRGASTLRLVPNRMQTVNMLVGCDTSQLLPPTIRAGRGQDVLRNEVSRCVHPAGWAVKLPFALPHLRSTPRPPLDPRAMVALGPEHLLWERARESADVIVGERAEERMAMLGALYEDLAGASDPELTSMLVGQAAEYTSRIVFGIREQLDDASLPGAWKDKIRSWLDSPTLKLDTASLEARIATLESVRTISRAYGRALIAWPRLWTLCRERFQ